jgi:tRNA(adenine34) deaminase
VTDEADERWMREAMAVAREGLTSGEVPIGAVVVLGDEVIGRAYTQEQSQRRLIVHADLLALEQADRALGRRRRRGASLYVSLEPCLMCLGAAMTAMIGTVVYALESPSDGAVSVASIWEEKRARDDFPGYDFPTIRSGVLRDASIDVLAEYTETHRVDDAYLRWVQALLKTVT